MLSNVAWSETGLIWPDLVTLNMFQAPVEVSMTLSFYMVR